MTTTVSTSTEPIIRGCGQRKPGGIYSCCGTSPWGTPIEHFMVDPPVPVSALVPEVASLGVQLFQDPNGIWHILDVVGQDSYVNVWNYISETKKLGMSRRLSSKLDFSKLTFGQSKHFLAHARVIIHNWEDYFDADLENMNVPSWRCPKEFDHHASDIYHDNIRGDNGHEFQQCLGVCRCDIEGGLPTGKLREVEVTGPMCNYSGLARPEGVTPQYEIGVFLTMPITNLEVISGSEESLTRYEAVYQATDVPVSMCLE